MPLCRNHIEGTTPQHTPKRNGLKLLSFSPTASPDPLPTSTHWNRLPYMPYVFLFCCVFSVLDLTNQIQTLLKQV